MFNQKKNKGFTIMELIIVVAIIAVLMTISIIGVDSYLENAEKNERESTAKTTYMAVQDYLTSIKKTGDLEEFNRSMLSYCTKITDDQIRTILENHYTEDSNRMISEYYEDHAGTNVVALTFSGGNKEHPLYPVMFNALANTDALNKSFVIEYNQTTGSVMSVFYSKSIDAFDSSALYNNTFESEYNIVLRDFDSLNKKKQGYYGVYKTALKGRELMLDPVEDEYHLSLINDDRIYVDIIDTTPYTAGENVSYTVDLFVQGSDIPLDTFNFRRSDITKIVDSGQTTTSFMDQIDNVDGSEGPVAICRQGITTENGKLADEYYLLIDCEHHSNVDNKYADLIVERTGLPVEKSKIYASVSLVVDGGIADIGTSEFINPVFADYDEARNLYTMSCTRHLNNIRNYGQHNSYALSDDINLKEFEREEDDHTVVEDKADRHYFESFEMIKCKNEAGNPVEFLGDFVGAKALVEDASLTIEDVKNTLSTIKPEECFTITAINIIKANVDEIGLFHNLPIDAIIGGVNFDELCVTGAKKVGGVCVKNAGRVEGVFLTNADIKGKIYVGGIISTANGPLTNLRFSGSVEGLKYYDDHASTASDPKKYLGGIVSESYFDITDCHFEGKVYSDEANVVDQYFGGITGRTYDNYGPAVISNCTARNFELRGEQFVGGIVGSAAGPVRDCEITGSYLLDNTHAPTANYEACIGGVAGTTTVDGTVTNCNIYCPQGELRGVHYDVYKNDIGSKAMGGVVGRPYGDIDNCYIELGKIYGFRDIGGIAGRCYSAKVSNCVAKIGLIETEGYAGGIVGVLYHDGGIIENCKTEASYDQAGNRIAGEIRVMTNGTNTGYSGGILGVHSAHITQNTYGARLVTVRNCENNLLVHSDMQTDNSSDNTKKASVNAIGGLVGCAKTVDLVVENSVNNGDVIIEAGDILVSASARSVGGLVGGVALTADSTDASHVNYRDFVDGKIKISDSVNNGNISIKGVVSATYVGGILGETNKLNEKCDITKSVNKGNISSVNPGTQYVSGILGGKPEDTTYDVMPQTITIDNCKNLGKLSNVTNAGGIFGYTNAKLVLNITNCENGDKDNIDGVVFDSLNKGTVGGIAGYLNKATLEVNISKTNNYAKILGDTAKLQTSSGGVANSVAILNVKECKNYGTMSGTFAGMQYIGGFVGKATGNTTITKCENYGALKFDGANSSFIGGVLGYKSNATTKLNVNDCTNEGDITASDTFTCSNSGGIIGKIDTKTTDISMSVIDGCVNIGNIDKGSTIGGVIGSAACSIDIKNCVSGQEGKKNKYIASGEAVAGIIGKLDGGDYSLNIAKCKNYTEIGSLSTGGINNVGGIVGYSAGPVKILYIDNVPVVNYGNFAFEGTMNYCGGIVGSAAKGIEVYNAENYGNMKAKVRLYECGGISGASNDDVKIENCHNYGDFESEGTMDTVAGCAGRTKGTTNISNFVNEGKIYAHTSLVRGAGTVGFACRDIAKDCLIKDCENTGSILADTTLKTSGGIVGQFGVQTTDEAKKAKKFELSGCVNKGQIVGKSGFADGVGGIIGYAASYADANIARCTNNADILFGQGGNSSKVGGILGKNISTPYYAFIIDNCTNNGKIGPADTDVTTYVNQVGGIVGVSESLNVLQITNSNNYGSLYNATSNSGGLIGDEYVQPILRNNKVGTVNRHVEIKSTTAAVDASCVGGIIGNLRNSNGYSQIAMQNNEAYVDILFMNENKKLSNVGGAIGYFNLANLGEGISNLKAEGKIISKGHLENAGGLFGNATFNLDIWNGSYSYKGNISADKNMNKVGGILGLAGKNFNGTSLKYVGNISAGGTMSNTGGLVGYITSGNTQTAGSVEGNISSVGTMTNVGGILGYTADGVSSYNNTTYVGDISSKGAMSKVGGFFGSGGGQYQYMQIQNPVIKANIISESTMDKVGGFCGNPTASFTLRDGVFKGNISSTGKMTNTGGFVGYSNTSVTLGNTDTFEGSLSSKKNMENVGGAVGYSDGECSLNKLEISADISSEDLMKNVGGAFGNLTKTANNSGLNLAEMKASGTINSKKKMQYVGGTVGYTERVISFNGAINVKTDIISEDAMQSVGGVFGYLKAGTSDGWNSINYSGLIKSKGMTENVGGVAGEVNASIKVCGSAINVNIISEGTLQYVGGIVGLGGVIGADNNGKIMLSANTVKPLDDKLSLIEGKTANCVGSFVGNVVHNTQSGGYIETSNSYGNIVAKDFAREYTCLGGMVGKVFMGGGNFLLDGNNYYGDIVIPQTAFIDLNGIGVGGLIGTAHTDDSKIIRNCHHRGKISRDKINGDVRIGYLVGHANKVTLEGDINSFADYHWSYNAYGKFANCTLPPNEIFDISTSYINNAEGYYEAEVKEANGSSFSKIELNGKAYFTVDTKAVSDNATGVKVSVKINRVKDGKIIGTENLQPNSQGIYTISNIKSHVNIVVTIDMEALNSSGVAQNIKGEPDNKPSMQSEGDPNELSPDETTVEENSSDGNDSDDTDSGENDEASGEADSDKDKIKSESEEQDTKTVSENKLNIPETGDADNAGDDNFALDDVIDVDKAVNPESDSENVVDLTNIEVVDLISDEIDMEEDVLPTVSCNSI